MIDTTRIVQFLDTGVSPEHVAGEIDAQLTESGSRRLDLHAGWSIERGEAVHVHVGGTVIAFRAGTAPPDDASLVIAAAHTDSPSLQLKHRSATVRDGMLQVPVEVYGAPIVATWLDRELTVAGKIAVVGDDGATETRLFAPRRPMAIIPNLAIHLNREVNKNLTYNRQEHLKALFPADDGVDGGPSRGDAPVTDARSGDDTERAAGDPSATDGVRMLHRLIAERAGVEPERLIDMELNLVPTATATTIAGTPGLIVSPRIDNLAGCYSVLAGFRESDEEILHSRVAVFYDHEEIGSVTPYGAAGDLTRQTIVRFIHALYGPGDHEAPIVSRSVLVSNDGAHARHPNYADKHDPGYAPTLGGGPVIKKSAVRRYASELAIAAGFERLCKAVDVPVQFLQNRSDIVAGSTIGPAVASRLAIPSVDVGVPMLAMHSVRETASVADIVATARVMQEVYTRGIR